MENRKQDNGPPLNMMGGPGKGRGRGPVMVREKPKDGGKTLKRLIKYIWYNKNLFIALMVVMLIITGLNLAIPAIQGKAIDCLSPTESTVDFGLFTKLLIFLIVLHIANSVSTYLQGIFSAELSQNTVKKMRSDLFAKIVYLPIKYFDTHRHGDIMSRMTNDVENISNTVSQSIGSVISGVLTVLGTFVIMLFYSPLLTAVSLISMVLTLFVTKFLTKHMRRFFLKQQVLLGSLNAHAEETISGNKTISAYMLEETERKKFNAVSDELKTYAINAQILGGSMGPVMNFISNFGYLLVAAAGGLLAWKGIITIGTIQVFLIYSKQFSRPINEIANQFAQIQTAVAGAERVFEIMDSASESGYDGKACNIKGSIRFKNVMFSYKKDEPVIRDFNLEVRAGQKIALVGATGSGKTTIVNLLTRFYDIDDGEILIDGININNIPRKSLRENIAIVLQDTVLFKDTIAKNISYGKNASDYNDIINAAATANARSFIERLPEGYDTELSEGGSDLSEGERQLLSIARAVLKDPQILILDEATSNVDTRTELNIQKAMIRLMKNRTSIIIAHRLSTIRDADLIVVLDNGVIAETGNHDELLEKKGCYYKLYMTQFAGKEI